jgi:hypothetical protein
MMLLLLILQGALPAPAEPPAAGENAPAGAPSAAAPAAAPSADPCQGDPRCRLARARARDAEQRRQAYLESLRSYAEAIERAEEQALPMRERHPLGADFMETTQLPQHSGVVGYSIAWPLRLEILAGKGSHHSVEDVKVRSGPATIEGTLDLTTVALQARLFTLREFLTPYFVSGLGFSFGTYTPSGSQELEAGAHSAYAGLGLDLQWEWFHAAIGYRLAWPFYTYARLNNQNVDLVKAAVSSSLEGLMHGATFEVGARY